MIVDSSALLAVLLQEIDRERYLAAISEAEPCRMSVANWFETAMVVGDRKDAEANEGFDDFICAADIELLPVTVEPAKAARAGRQRFGKGNHPAHLNCDDCFAYALAKVEQDKLLCKGDDFPQTDIESALKP